MKGQPNWANRCPIYGSLLIATQTTRLDYTQDAGRISCITVPGSMGLMASFHILIEKPQAAANISITETYWDQPTGKFLTPDTSVWRTFPECLSEIWGSKMDPSYLLHLLDPSITIAGKSQPQLNIGQPFSSSSGGGEEMVSLMACPCPSSFSFSSLVASITAP
jgi:hypothetical protein